MDPHLSMYRQRLIPACAGKTWITGLDRDPNWAHPRVCGENGTPQTGQRVPVGSSPRVRGKRSRPGPSLGNLGLIPACAGKTVMTYAGGAEIRAHPRVCGENHTVLITIV